MKVGQDRSERGAGTRGSVGAIISEFLGTALLVFLGCSLVVADFGRGSPMVSWIPDSAARRALTGFLFGTVGGSIALSRLGKVSGAHINPVVTLAFWTQGKMTARLAGGYMVAQLVGGVLGAVPLLLWGNAAQSVHDAATLPGPGGVVLAAAGETVATFCLVTGLFLFVGSRRLRQFTPFLFPFLYGVLVWLEAPLSGTSTNPARSLGPALVAHAWQGWWVYWAGPLMGMGAALAVLNAARPLVRWEVEVAKLYHFHHDPFGLFRAHHHSLAPSRSPRAGSPEQS